MKKWVSAVILAALVAIGIFSGSASASVVTVTETTHNEKHASTGLFIRFKVLSYVKAQGLTKEEVANAEECRMIGEGTDVPVYTNSGIGTDGNLFKFEDTDREKACKVNGQWRLVRCGNFVWFEILPHIFHGHVLLVRTFAHKKIHIRIPLRVVVPSPCGGPPAESVAFIKQWVKYRAVVKAKGDVKIRISGKIIDRVKAHVRAGVTCEHTTTTITEEGSPPPPPHNCVEEPKQEKCKPTVAIETINDMYASRNGHEYKRYICWHVYPGAESSLGSMETKLHVEYGEELGSVEYRGGNQFCQFYRSPGEFLTEEYYAWARDTHTHAYGQSATKTFGVGPEPSFE